MPIIEANRLRRICIELLVSVGAPREKAQIVADTLVRANLRGVDTHGVLHLPAYVKRAQLGLINPRAEVQVERESRCIAVLNANLGFGQVAAFEAMSMAIRKAKDCGISAVGVHNTNHIGMLAYYSMMALEHDMIGISICNVGPSMCPWRGKERILGNNPISYAIPADKEASIVLDMALSVAAGSKVILAKRRGEKIPEGWAVNALGQPTTDPSEVRGSLGWIGSLLPIGGHKGYGLSLVFDILCGALTGAKYSRDVLSIYDFSKVTSAGNAGNLMMAIDIAAFNQPEVFKERVDDLIRTVKSSPTASGASEVLIPGEIESREEEKRLKEGINITDEIWSDVMSLSKEFKMKI